MKASDRGRNVKSKEFFGCFDEIFISLHGLVEINNCNFIRIHQSSRTRGNGMKLYKEQCSIDARHQFFSNRVVDLWNSLPAAVVLSPSVTVCKRKLAKLTFSSFLLYC